MLSQVVKPLEDPIEAFGQFKHIVFLGGSIEMGVAEDWQTRITEEISDFSVQILNPRRDDWDSSWIQDPTEGTPFRQQVDWELENQDYADTLVYYFVPGTQSPITLMELGLYAYRGGDVFVCCPKEFWRYGNVAVVCETYGVNLFTDEASFIEALRYHLAK